MTDMSETKNTQPEPIPGAIAPFLDMEREWTDEEKRGLEEALRRYGWE